MPSNKPLLDHKFISAVCMMTMRIVKILNENGASVYLCGSTTMGDFKLGWSDIDILVLTKEQISASQAEELVDLRQTMLAAEPLNPYYRLFEGGMLTLDAFLTDKPDRVVYWGTSGQRITDRYVFNSLSVAGLLGSGILVYGDDVRGRMTVPKFDDLCADIERHYESIRQCARQTDGSFYSFGWLLDIARCIYTLRTGKLIAKTAAGEWALRNNLCPDKAALEYALSVRNDPLNLKDSPDTIAYAQTLSEPIQRFADVLEAELKKHKH